MKLTIADSALLLGVPEPEVYSWIRSRGLPYVKVQDRYFIHRARLHEWARDHGVQLHPDVFTQTQAGQDAGGAELADAIRLGGVHPLPTPQSERDGAAAILDVVRLPPAVDMSMLCEILSARRALGFSIDREGIALPRLAEPILGAGAPALSLFAFDPPCRLDGIRASRVFVLVAPTVRTHQRLLAELDAALHQPGFREAVLRADPSGQLEEVARKLPIQASSIAAK